MNLCLNFRRSEKTEMSLFAWYVMSDNSVFTDTTHGLIRLTQLRMQVKNNNREMSLKLQSINCDENLAVSPITTKNILTFHIQQNEAKHVRWLNWTQLNSKLAWISPRSTTLDERVANTASNTTGMLKP